ncbi:MAG: uracil-DNA glycosylase [Bacteroidia bacterium]|nr:uracil-DNA glycosylase [Bacteroidia bacterium]MCZ2277010.1 uracil-DNA glycosylase [Bacteroidia bacterium]
MPHEVNEKVKPEIEHSWLEMMKQEFESDYFFQIKTFLKNEIHSGKTIYPPGKLIFNAFNCTPFNQVTAVIVGQDPYHGQGQANGLCFSVNPGIVPPPSLLNIFKELKSDLAITPPEHGDLTGWAEQGVLLLNASLTVQAGFPNSHSKIGWHQFTDAVIHKLSSEKENIVFLLWGKFAQSKKTLIDNHRHLILEAAHPSPYSASAGFFGCRHFSKVNEYLKNKGIKEIDWHL